MAEDNLHVSPEFLDVALDGHAPGDASMLAFQDPEAFVAGNLHSRVNRFLTLSQILLSLS